MASMVIMKDNDVECNCRVCKRYEINKFYGYTNGPGDCGGYTVFFDCNAKRVGETEYKWTCFELRQLRRCKLYANPANEFFRSQFA